jgi:hypothetical protein
VHLTELLSMYRRFFGPGDEEFEIVLDHKGEGNLWWRLDLLKDSRYKETEKATWVYQEWADIGAWSSFKAYLKDDEVFGFLKAKYPELDVKLELKMDLIRRFNNIIKELEKIVD